LHTASQRTINVHTQISWKPFVVHQLSIAELNL
jgi:hypothetical protein